MNRYGLSALMAAVVLAPTAALAEWQPDRPVNVLVPWPAGGITDQAVRVAAGVIEEALGQPVVVVNQPGASGAIATQAALDADRDGYTWASGGPQDLGAYKVLGMLDTDIRDWHLFLVAATATVVSVNPETPWQTLPELIEAMEAEPGAITVATAGLNSAGHLAIGALSSATGIEYNHVPYDGGNPAVIATVAGETQVVTQLAPEQAEMIRAGRLRPLAVMATEPLNIGGFGDIPPVSDFVPGLAPKTNYTGIFLPHGVPDEVVARLEEVWREHVADAPAIRDWAADRGALPTPFYGDEAQEVAYPTVQNSVWLYYDTGRAEISPEDVGIPRP